MLLVCVRFFRVKIIREEAKKKTIRDTFAVTVILRRVVVVVFIWNINNNNSNDNNNNNSGLIVCGI